jgi:hypothetical protein
VIFKKKVKSNCLHGTGEWCRLIRYKLYVNTGMNDQKKLPNPLETPKLPDPLDTLDLPDPLSKTELPDPLATPELPDGEEDEPLD